MDNLKTRSNTFLNLVVLLILLISLPVAVYLSQQGQDIRQRAQTTSPVTFLDSAGNPTSQTSTATVNVELSSPFTGATPTTPPSQPTPTTPPAPTTPPTTTGTTSLEFGTWNPNPTYDTCTKAEHDSYFATGPDGKKYSTWHPIQHTRANGTKCTFGHEHGFDPTNAPALKGRPMLFGYAAERLGMAEPHTGFKVIRWDNIDHPNGPDHKGAFLLMELHQGTSGAGRFTQPNHSMSFHYLNPTDGREVHADMMAPFGELQVTCTSGPGTSTSDGGHISIQQGGGFGTRQLGSQLCNQPYEIWTSKLFIGNESYPGAQDFPAQAGVAFEVHHNITYCILTGTTCALGYFDTLLNTGQNPLSPQAAHKGSDHGPYLNEVFLNNGGRPTTIWTDAYGHTVAAGTPNAIAQYVSAVNVQTFFAPIADTHVEFDDGTVHAPN